MGILLFTTNYIAVRYILGSKSKTVMSSLIFRETLFGGAGASIELNLCCQGIQEVEGRVVCIAFFYILTKAAQIIASRPSPYSLHAAEDGIHL